MYLDLTETLRTPGKTVERAISLAPQMLDDIELATPTTGVVRATNARQSVVVGGKAQASVVMQCARCLKNFAQPLELELEAVAPMSFFRKLLPNAIGAPDEDEEEADEEIISLFDDNSLDVTELIRQAIVLQSPIQPLCSADCTGLPEAEKYLETGEDHRLDALKNWNKKEQNGTPEET